MIPSPLNLEPTDERLVDAVSSSLAGIERLGVAFSGGVDSAALLAIAARALGRDRVVALLGVSASLASRERQIAHDVAMQIGVEIVEFETHELQLAEYRRNDADRCFHCKNTLFTVISDQLVERLGLTAVAYGENADDAKSTDRPGQAAARHHEVLRPLAACGVDKAAVRRIAQAFHLPVAMKPATPCLASRIAPHVEVTEARLLQVEQVEAAIFELGFSDVRVRHLGTAARVELPKDQLHLASQDGVRQQIVIAALAAGFERVTLDLNGLQSGSFARSLLNSAHDRPQS